MALSLTGLLGMSQGADATMVVRVP